MTTFFTHHNFAVFFGLLGNVVSFMVYLSPTPTFYKIYQAKATQGFDPLPYAVALFSSMLTLYYGLIKQANGTLLITINSVGIVIESIYLTLFMVYASKSTKWKTSKLLLSFNVGLLGLIILLSSLLTHGAQREAIIGWICAICSVCFFASPLCVIRSVIKTKSVEFMPFWLSFSLTVCAIMWFFYGFFIKDFYVALPNVLGLAFGITQMTLYFIYKESTKKIIKARMEGTLPKTTTNVVNANKLEIEQVKMTEQLVAIDVKPADAPNCKNQLLEDNINNMVKDIVNNKVDDQLMKVSELVSIQLITTEQPMNLDANNNKPPAIECAV